MFNETLKNKYPFVTHFFEKALSNNGAKLYQAYLLTGSDVLGQYFLALSVAKILNCESGQNDGCDCVNCRWIKENKHPAVLTVSPIDFKEDENKTVISIEQARNIKKFLSMSSPYHRVIIFTNAQEENIDKQMFSEAFEPYQELGMHVPRVSSDDDERLWLPKTLNKNVFRDEAVNALLKTIEEPPKNVTFFFLTQDREDVINTIVSRCQVLNVSTGELRLPNTDFLSDFLSKFPPKTEKDAVYMCETFLALAQQNSMLPEYALACLQEYLRKLIEANVDNKFIVNNIVKQINLIELSKSQILSRINPKNVLESLFLKLVKIHSNNY